MTDAEGNECPIDTHAPRFVRHADRTIRLFDGQVVDEEGRTETPAVAAAAS